MWFVLALASAIALGLLMAIGVVVLVLSVLRRLADERDKRALE